MFLWMIGLLDTEIKVFNTDFLALFYQRCLYAITVWNGQVQLWFSASLLVLRAMDGNMDNVPDEGLRWGWKGENVQKTSFGKLKSMVLWMAANKTNTQATYPLKENQRAQLVIKIK